MVALGSVLGHDRGRGRRAARRGRRASARVGIKSFRPFPLEEVRAALGHAKRVVVLEKALAVGRRRHRLGERAHGAVGHPAARLHRDRRPRRARRSRQASLRAPVRATRSRTGSSRSPSSTWTGRSSRRSCGACGRAARSRPARREHPARHRRRRGPVALRRARGPSLRPAHALPGQQSASTKRAASWSATGCSTPTALGAGAHRALEHAHLGPSRLPGLRRGARRALRARRRDARDRRQADRRQRDRLPGGVLDPLPRVVVAAARGSTRCSATPPAVATGIAAAMKVKGRERRARRRPGRRRRHGRHRVRLPVGDVRAQRRRALHLLRQRGLHEHRRAALRRHAARGAHGHHEAGRRASRATSSARARTRR